MTKQAREHQLRFSPPGQKLNKNAGILLSPNFGTDNINSSGTLIVNAGGLVSLNGTYKAVSNILIAGNSIIDVGGNSFITSSSSIELDSSGDIGSTTKSLNLSTPDLLLNAGDYIGVSAASAGALDISRATAGGDIYIEALGRDVSSSGPIRGDNVLIKANSFGTFQKIVADSSLTLDAAVGAITSATFTTVETPNLTLEAETIGSLLQYYFVPAGVETISSKATLTNYLDTSANKSIQLGDVTSATSTVDIYSTNSIETIGKISGKNISFDVRGKSLEIGNDLTAVDTLSIGLILPSSKLVIAKGVEIRTTSAAVNGDVSIQLGEPTSVPAPPNPNLNISGDVLVFGAGVSAKSPINNLQANGGPQLVISNSGKSSKNITLGGDVLIQAGP